jgi:sugar phosphate isomerase/epimerase
MIGISCPGFCMTPFSDLLEKIAPHFKLWEIIAEGMHEMRNIKAEIKNAMDSYDMRFTVHAPFSDLNLASLNPRIRKSAIDQVREAIKISSELGIDVITIHPGYKSPLGVYFEEKFQETNKESIKELDKIGQEFNMTLALENMPKMWISLCHDANQMMELVNETGIKLCFDLGHANISGTIQEIMELKEDFANIHIHDNHGDRDYHLVLGEGNIDIPGILKQLSGYKGDHIIESTNLEEGIRSKLILEKMLNSP